MDNAMSHERHVSAGDTTSLQTALPNSTVRGALACVVLGNGRSSPLTRPCKIGRAPECDVAIDDHVASREHALLEPGGDGRVTITDLGSRNGTFVDGVRISRVEVVGAGLVRAGDTVIRIATFTEEVVACDGEGPLVGGTALGPVRRTLGLVGPTDLPVLVLGETGTGKDVIARVLHTQSRREGPFVAVNCAALPEALIESELFGHVRGSFTGATTSRRGLFGDADGGTLFLDEIGELSLTTQAKLLRVLEDKIVRPVGGEHERRVDVRVVSATNRDLHGWARDGGFRLDLLARLAAVELRLPPLRHRVEDLLALVQYLWTRAQHHSVIVTANALEALALYRWPHNIRELDHALRTAALVDPRVLDLDALPDAIQAGLRDARTAASAPRTTASPVDLRGQIEASLQLHRGNLRRVGFTLGISRGHLYRLLKRWNLDPSKYRQQPGTDSALEI
jgi:hypothetical protein